MIKYLKIVFLSLTVVFLATGCTHKIDITPESSDEELVKDSRDYNVGYYLSSSDREKYVVTAGGGGDSIGYYPYKDIEMGFRNILLQNFNKVYRVKKIDDIEFIKEKKIKYLFTYDVTTTSSSSNIMTWPPENFTLTLSCDAFNNEGKKSWQETVIGIGNATFSEYKTDFPIAGRKASKDALSKMLFKINNSEEF